MSSGGLSVPRVGRVAASTSTVEETAYVRYGFKRALDVVITASVLLFIMPLLPLIVLGLIIQDGAPVIYRQKRVGLGGSRFDCLKFRSMARDAKERLDELLRTSPEARAEWQRTQKLRSDPRIHPFGQLLRKSSLDELPQLINVLRGEMSLVGPRPMMPEQLQLYGDSVRNYVQLRPGITGLWQVSGRNNLSFAERRALDDSYAAKVTFLGDLRILLRTVYVVLVGHGSC